MALNNWLKAIVALLYPQTCVVCGLPLSSQGGCLCVQCDMKLPRTNLHRQVDNAAEQLFWGKTTLQRATSYFYYHRGSDFRQILHRLKYRGEKEIGTKMGRQLAAELLVDGFFDGVDYLLPVPLHPKKQRIRGYNQSEYIALGISAVTGIPLLKQALTRQKYTETQTRKSVFERWANVEGIFKLHTPQLLEGKHVLLIDDVLTTGSTCVACADAFSEIPHVQLSVLTLAMATV